MGITGKIILWFIGGVVLFFLIIVTFFQSQDTVFDELQISWESEEQSFTWGYIHELGLLDTLYSSSEEESFSTRDVEWVSVVDLESWEYFIDIRDAHTPYSLQTPFFEIIPVGIGKVYINTTNSKEYIVTSFNNSLALTLRDGKDEPSDVTEIYLYPHMSLEFNPTRSRFMKQADLIRIASVFDLSYYTDPFFTQESWLAASSEFLQAMVSHISENDIKKQEDIWEIMDLQVWSFPGEWYIKKYFSLFVNDEKKKVYYKNIALDKILNLVNSTSRNSWMVNQAYSALQQLQVYPEDYKQMIEVFNYTLRAMTHSYQTDHIYPRINLADLDRKIRKLDPQTQTDYLSSYILDTLYGRFDFLGEYSYSTLGAFFETYLKELWIDIVQEQEVEDIDTTYLEYFSFFVENVIISRFDSSVEQNNRDLLLWSNLGDILRVMQWYISLNSIIYSNRGDTKAITLIYKYISVLESIERFTWNWFFESERTKDNLLVKNTQESITWPILILLSGNTNSILDFYTDNKKFLDRSKQRDVFISEKYNALLELFPEYFSALENYESYVFNYDDVRKNLLDIATFNSHENITLSKQNFLAYISRFKSLSLDSLKLDIIDDSYYKVSWIFIEGKQFSFHLYPFQDNKIDTITINKAPINSSYKLDNIESEWKEKTKWFSGNRWDEYDFSLFFSNTFLQQETTVSEIFEVSQTVDEEDKVIVVFKRDRLLGERGEFSGLTNNLYVEYSDLQVLPSGQGYDISLKDAIVSIEYQNSKGISEDFTATFASDYLLTSDKHQFRNVVLHPYANRSLGQKSFPLDDNTINLVGSINIWDFRQTFSDFALSYNSIIHIHDVVLRELDIRKIDIRYSIFSKKTTMKFDYNSENITIEIAWDLVTSVKKWNTNLLKNASPYRDFPEVIPLIK